MDERIKRAIYLYSKSEGYGWRISSDEEYKHYEDARRDSKLQEKVDKQLEELNLTYEERIFVHSNMDYDVADRIYRGWDD